MTLGDPSTNGPDNPETPDTADGAGALTLERLVNCPDDATRDELVKRAGGNRALRRLADEAEALAGRAVQQAIEQVGVLTTVVDRLGGSGERSRVRRARAHALAYGGRLAESLAVCDEAIGLASVADPVEAARAKLASMQPLCLLGRVQEAIAAGTSARDELLRMGQQDLAARADLNLANVEKRRGNAREALAYLDRARTLVSGNPALAGIVENARGESLLLLDDFSNAEAAFHAAAAHYAPLGATFLLAMIEGNLAEVLARRGRLHDALSSYETARRHFEREGAAGQAATVRIAHAEAMEVLGLPADSLAGFDAAAALLAPLGRRIDLGRVLLGRARALSRLRRHDEARSSLLEASSAFKEVGNARGALAADVLLGELLVHLGRIADARSLLEPAAMGSEDAPLHATAAEHHLATVAMAEGNLEEAAARLERAVDTAVHLGVPTLLADILHTRGMLRRRLNDSSGALADFSRAIESIERVRGLLHAERLRASFLGNRVATYQALVGTLLDRGGPAAADAAFSVAEQAKSRTLLEVARGGIDLAISALRLSDDVTERSLADELDRVQSDLNALYSQLADGEPNQRRVGSAQWISAIREQERVLVDLEHRVAATSLAPMALSHPADIPHIAADIAAETALAEFFIAEGELMAWVVRQPTGASSREASVLVRRLAGEADIAEAVGRLQFQLGRALRHVGSEPSSPSATERLLADFRIAAQRVHALAIAPLRGALEGVRRLIIVPHGPLHLVPWPAVRSETSWLIEECEIEVTPSASFWLRAGLRTEVPDLSRATVIGVPDALAPSIDAEVQAVAAALATRDAISGEGATAGRTLEALQTSPVVHIACHGRFSSDIPRSSGLRLADRWLTTRDLERIRIPAALVTLSGCDTGRCLVTKGDELLGLLRGFLLAGAHRLIVSLWSTHDQTATELMAATYDSLAIQAGTGMFDPALALREAQLDLLARRPHPIHWAPFVLVGRS